MQIDSFIQFLSSRTRSAETLRAYEQDLSRLQTFLEEKGLEDNQVTPTTIAEFVRWMEDGKGRTLNGALAPATISRRLAVVSAYYEFLRIDLGEPIQNPVKRMRRPRVQNAIPRAADDNVLATLVDGITDSRDRALVLLLIYSGLRISEVRQLDKTSITIRRRKLPDGSTEYLGQGEVLGKGNKRRAFLVGSKAMEAIRDYIAKYRMKDSLPALFISSRKKRLSNRAIEQILSKWCVRLGVPHLHPHQLRHSYATRNVNAGMSAPVLQSLLGHASLATSQRYFTIGPERLSREYFSVMEYVNQFSPV
jgi:site-specific recombinase XerD